MTTREAARPRGAVRRAMAHYSFSLPVLIARIAIGCLYLLLSSRVAIGPPWLMLALVGVFFLPINLARMRGNHRAVHYLLFTLAGLGTLVLVVSAALLVRAVVEGGVPAGELLQDGVGIWLANLLTFTLWYWQIDTLRPHRRPDGCYESEDFVFPQMTLRDGSPPSWRPGFVDYLFVAFNTSTAFSPTDALVLSRRAKCLMMLQATISLLVISVLVARAINTLGGSG